MAGIRIRRCQRRFAPFGRVKRMGRNRHDLRDFQFALYERLVHQQFPRPHRLLGRLRFTCVNQDNCKFRPPPKRPMTSAFPR